MRYVWNILLKGLAAVLPIGLTLYLVYWFGVSIERLFRPAVLKFVPEDQYWSGMGLVAGLVLLFFIGLVVNAWVIRHLFRFGEDLIERIPLIKSIYGALRDFLAYFSAAQKREEMGQVVLVNVNDMRLIGFLTSEKVQDLPGLPDSEQIAAVYLPMSYQIGGYTAYLPLSKVEPIDMSFEDAMRRVLTAGLSKPEK